MNGPRDCHVEWSKSDREWEISYDIPFVGIQKEMMQINLQRDITLLTKVHLVKAMVFPVVMCGCELEYKEAECWKTDAFGLWCWRKLLSVPWTTRRSDQSILKEISPEYSLEILMLKLKLQYFGHLMWRPDSLEKTLMLGKDWRQKEKGTTEDEVVGWHHQLNGHEFEQALGVGDGRGSLVCCRPRGHK